MDSSVGSKMGWVLSSAWRSTMPVQPCQQLALPLSRPCPALPLPLPCPCPQVLGACLRHACNRGQGHLPRAAPAPGTRGARLCPQVSGWVGNSLICGALPCSFCSMLCCAVLLIPPVCCTPAGPPLASCLSPIGPSTPATTICHRRERPTLVGKSQTKQTAQQKRKAQAQGQRRQKPSSGGATGGGKRQRRKEPGQLVGGGSGMYNLA